MKVNPIRRSAPRIVVALSLWAAAPADAQTNDALRAELLAMYAADQKARDGFGAAAAANDTLYGRRMIALDSIHTSRLKEIVRTHGWPGRSRVGAAGSHAAWILLQHSPDLQFQKAMLVELGRPANEGEVAPGELAMLTDRVRTEEGLKQLYGTRFDIRDGALVLFPIENEAELEQRRARVGLPPMEEYIRQMERMTGLKLKRPDPGGSDDSQGGAMSSVLEAGNE